ncbi:MAG: carboxypeptidase-like regulatory domain-containing protein [Pyrinomonadaceae bacterium]
MRITLKFVGSLILFLCLGIDIFAQELKGFVKNQDGKPISEVFVQPEGYIYSTKTDANGFFNLRMTKYWEKGIVFFDKKGFQAQAVPVDSIAKELNIVLKDEENSEIVTIPNCTANQDKNVRLVGHYLILSAPKKLKFKSGTDTDYIYYRIGFGKGNNKSWLEGGLGNLYGSEYPSSNFIDKSTNFSYRRTNLGLDWRGITNDGIIWRWIGSVSIFETYYYQTKSKEAAEVFDKILDGMCFQSEK